MAGTFPGAKCVGHAGVLVVHDGVEVMYLFQAGGDKATDGGGAGDTAFAALFPVIFRAANCGAVGGEVLDEGRRERMRNEFGRDSRLVELDKDGVGGGQQRIGCAVGGRPECVVESRLVLRDGVGGAGDVLDIQTQGT